jgi:VanZ family protein
VIREGTRAVGPSDRFQAVLAWLAVIAWIALITTFSGEGFSKTSTSRFIGPLLHWLFPNAHPETLDGIHFVIRKAAHAAEYGVLALLALGAVRRSVPLSLERCALAALALVLAVGGSDEIHQAFVPSRTAAFADAMLDLAGGACAVGIVFALRRWAAGRGPAAAGEPGP